MRLFLIFLFLAITQPASAEVKISIDTTGWTTKQIVLMEAVAYKMAYANGEDIVPIKTKEGDLIFSNLTQTTADKIKQKLLDEINKDMVESEANRQAGIAKENLLKTNAENKLKALGLTSEEIEALKGD